MNTPLWIQPGPVRSDREHLNVARWVSYSLKATVAVPLSLYLVLLDCLDAMRLRADRRRGVSDGGLEGGRGPAGSELL
jgi:hypothetical protein